MTTDTTRQNRIAAARKALAEAYAANPEAVRRYEARKARLEAAARRERERVTHLVLGEKRPEPDLVRPDGMSKAQWKVERKRLKDAGGKLSDPEIEAQLAMRERWSHKQYGTPETWDRDGKHSDALHQMERNGTLSHDQVEWAAEIANVHRSIESDVAVKVASLEARVDQSRGNGADVVEGVRRVRLHLAYGIWREGLPDPKQLVLDMIVGDRLGYTVVAKRYQIGNARAKGLLVQSIDRWPDCVDLAYKRWSRESIVESRMNLAD